jgi:peroxiredoxin Q/BCP
LREINVKSRRIQIGDEAPDFTLPSQTGEEVKLSSYRGNKNVVLYFYPKDNTPGCTKEACAFRDSYEAFKEAGAEVIGISSDSQESHGQFVLQFALPFILVSDEGAKIRKSYGVPSSMGMVPGRVTYVIDKKGVVGYIFNSQTNIEGHVQESLKRLRGL